MAFSLLHPEVQRWVYDQGWTELRAAQVEAVAPILAGETDVIISAATASGKTEAAYLPICSALATAGPTPGISVLYLSPLKALINDQFARLEPLFERLDIPLHRWHGDVPGSQKAKVRQNPSGVLLTTPESLEAMFVLRGASVGALFGNLRYLVVDELHSFIGTERGAQLQSLAHRLELAVRRRIPRIALSATLGDMGLASEFLRPGAGEAVKVIVAEDDGGEVRLQLRGYLVTAPSAEGSERPNGGPAADDGETPQHRGPSEPAIAQHLFETLRGTNNLIFANARQQVELYADRLTRLSDRARVPNEFFAHHGSLSAEHRQDVEARLKDRSLPVNAVCTSTLEMGIDIGDTRSIAQIGAPPSVSSMRQRLGRSGRRGEPAVLRLYISEREVDARTSPPDALRAELVQTIAMVNLLLRRWYEPPVRGDLHLSTLVQQLLSLIAEHSGVQPDEAYGALCGHGPFTNVSASQFAALVDGLARRDVIVRAAAGLLLHGEKGERIVNHYSFFAAFNTPEEWRLVSSGRQLGTLPINEQQPMAVGAAFIFAGRRWRIVGVDAAHKVVDLVPAPGGAPPRFVGVGPLVHDQVRREMYAVYRSAEVPAYLDATAVDLLLEGRQNFLRYRLDEMQIITSGMQTYVFLWAGDRVMHTVAAALVAEGLSASHEGLALGAAEVDAFELTACLSDLADRPEPDPVSLARVVANKMVEKHDRLLPSELLDVGYAARTFDAMKER